ncbi:MAG: MMPL family transporter, partial [Calditrichaceae bacterium]
KKLTGSQTAGENITVYRGRLFNKALNHILIIGQPEFKSTDTGRSRAMINFLDEQFTQSEEQSNGLVDVAYLSAHRFSVENAARIQSDIQRTVSIALIAIILLSLLVYSRPVLMVLTLLPALFGSAFSLGLIRIFNPAISAIIIGSGAMLIGITVDYGIHFLYHLDQSEADKFKPVSTAEHLLKPLILSAGTTMAAFLALQFSALPGYRQLGLFVMLGIFGSLLFVILILPLM